MEILGIGLPELVFIGLILLLILGPTELVTLGRKTGQFVRRVRKSDTWIMIANLASALRNLPNALADETRAEEIFRNIVPDRDRRTIAPPDRTRGAARPQTDEAARETRDGYTAWTTPPSRKIEPADQTTEDPPAPEDTDRSSDTPDRK